MLVSPTQIQLKPPLCCIVGEILSVQHYPIPGVKGPGYHKIAVEVAQDEWVSMGGPPATGSQQRG